GCWDEVQVAPISEGGQILVQELPIKVNFGSVATNASSHSLAGSRVEIGEYQPAEVRASRETNSIGIARFNISDPPHSGLRQQARRDAKQLEFGDILRSHC